MGDNIMGLIDALFDLEIDFLRKLCFQSDSAPSFFHLVYKPLYDRMMEQIRIEDDDVESCGQILSAITLAYRPLAQKMQIESPPFFHLVLPSIAPSCHPTQHESSHLLIAAIAGNM
jgi:hypothetical protein